MTPFTWTDDYSRTDPSTHVARNGASGLVYQEKGLKTRHMLACQEEWASPGQEPPGKTRFSVKALRIGKRTVAGYDYVVVAVHEGKLIFGFSLNDPRVAGRNGKRHAQLSPIYAWCRLRSILVI